MELLSLALPLLLAAFGVLIIVGFFKLLYGALGPMLRDTIESSAVSRAEALLRSAEAQLGRDPAAVSTLKRSLLIYSGGFSNHALQRAHGHNLSVLARLLAFADRYQLRLEQLPVIEDLLSTRVDLIRAIAEIDRTSAKVREERSAKGKEIPEWAAGRFEERRDELADQLTVNARSLQSSIEALFSALKQTPDPDRVTYH